VGNELLVDEYFINPPTKKQNQLSEQNDGSHTSKGNSNLLDWHGFSVFEDLWNRGYYITSASKFGGDFLLYEGDPMQYHAQYVVIVCPWKELLSPLDIVSYGRLGVTVKKTPVLASVRSFENQTDERYATESNQLSTDIRYFSIDWQGVT
jgi:tRNA-intron lyase